MRVIQIPLLRDNYGYLIVCPDTGEAAVVDPSEGEPVLRAVEAEKVELKAILNTHHHRDHTGGNSFLLERLNLRVYGHRVDRERIPGLSDPVEEGDEVTVGKLRGKVLFIPGHTKGHVAYLFGEKLFCGDTLFAGGCGRLFEGTAEQMLASLARLKALPDSTLVYCGHEYTQKNLEFALTLEETNPKLKEKLNKVRSLRARGQPTVPSTIAEEKETNPFLRWDSPAIHETLRRKSLIASVDPLAVFSKVRELKDQY
ncbi:MAG TPA: hydroxyacylglutathione hydrolase [Candidatus Acidoferrales bacterium]|nr:hydroxyacylglutathione hydrolase [Candidatus Acidoferrales bacterium]